MRTEDQMQPTRSSRTVLRRIQASTLALLSTLALSTPLSAAGPPAGRTYFTVVIGLEGSHAITATCLEFGGQTVGSLDGQLLGSWQRETPRGKTAGLSFDLAATGDGDSMEVDGHARLDARAAGSSLAGTARLVAGGARFNFGFAGREVSPASCERLVHDFGDDPPSPDVDVVGSGVLLTETRPVGRFDAVSVTNSGGLVIEQGAVESLTITAEDNILPLISSRVRNGRLELFIDSSGDVRTTRPITYRLTVRELDELTAGGSAEVKAAGVEGETFTVDLEGSSTATVDGSVQRQVIRVSGSARYVASDLESRAADVELSGNSQTLVRVRDSITGTAAGSSRLEYIGDPSVDVETSGSATVTSVGG